MKNNPKILKYYDKLKRIQCKSHEEIVTVPLIEYIFFINIFEEGFNLNIKK